MSAIVANLQQRSERINTFPRDRVRPVPRDRVRPVPRTRPDQVDCQSTRPAFSQNQTSGFEIQIDYKFAGLRNCLDNKKLIFMTQRNII